MSSNNIIKGTPITYAKELTEQWSSRLRSAQRMEVGRRVGCFASKSLKDREIAQCLGALFVLSLIENALYVQ